MDRKTFFKSGIGVMVAAMFAKPVIESLQEEKTDAEKMLDGAKAIDDKLETELVNWKTANYGDLMKQLIVEDESGSYIKIAKTD